MKLVSSSDLSEIGDVGDGTHRESFMNETVVDEHVGHPEDRNSKASAEAETRNKAFMEEAVRKKSYGGHSVDNGENIVQFERSFSWFMVRLVHMP